MGEKLKHLARSSRRAAGAGRKKADDASKKKMTTFLKKYPNLSAQVVYYMFMASVMLGGGMANGSANDSDGAAVQMPVTTAVVNGVIPREKSKTYAEFLEKIRPIEPLIIADLVSKEGVRLNKAGLHVPYYDHHGKCWTIGFGSTILQDGSSVKATTKPLTTEQAYELVRWHLEQHTFFAMFCYEAGLDNVNIDTTGEAFTIASLIYNTGIKMIETPSKGSFKNVNLSQRNNLLHQDFNKYGNELPASLVRQRFEEYPVTNTESVGSAWLGGKGADIVADNIGNFLVGGDGILWRRWIEAGIISGEVDPASLIEAPMGSLSVFVGIVGKDRANWFTGDAPNRKLNKSAYAQFREWLKNPVDKYGFSLAGYPKVKDYLPEYARKMCESGQCQIGSGIVQIPAQSNKSKSPMYADATKKLKNKKATDKNKAKVIVVDGRDIK